MIGSALIVLVLSFAGTGLALRYLRHRAILDHPNGRSSHEVPVPRGGGLAVTPILLVAWVALLPVGEAAIVCGSAMVLAVLSWIDDRRGLSPAIRFPVQVAVVTGAIAAGILPGAVFGGLLPPVVDAVAAGIVWVWFVNLFNFMDGSDGITGVETLGIGFGAACVGAMGVGVSMLGDLGLTAAAVAAGFLFWNWHPAKLFLGDVGSIPLGFLLGWLLLALAGSGYGIPALILPLYYLADATITLLRRLLRGERIWRPHREHFYQRAIQRGMGHARVAVAVLICNAVLVACAAGAIGREPWAFLAVATMAVACLGTYFRYGCGAPGDGADG